MVDYNTIGAIVFVILLAVFLYFKKDSLTIEKIAYPLLYFVMYRTKLGLNLMSFLGTRHKKTVIFFGTIGIYIGFAGMILIAYTLVQSIITIAKVPDAPSGIMPVLPIQAKGVFFVPFFYWIITIFIIAVVHEIAHGIVARAYNIKVKSSGFAFLGILLPIIPAAFVEPDEKSLQKKPKKQQLAVFAAGPLANILLAVFLMIAFIFVINPVNSSIVELKGLSVIDYSGESAAEKAGIPKQSTIIAINNHETRSMQDLVEALSNKKPGDNIVVHTENEKYNVILGENPEDNKKPYLGVSLAQKSGIKESLKNSFFVKFYIWVAELIKFLILLSLGIGLFNLVPIGPVDGGRMLHVALHNFFAKEKANYIFNYVSLFFLGLIVVSLFVNFI